MPRMLCIQVVLVKRGSVVSLKALGWVLLANVVAPLIGVAFFMLLHNY